MRTAKSYAPAIAWGIFIFVLSVWPGKDFPQLNFWWEELLSVDKLVHFTFYALLTALILRGYFGIKNEKLKIKDAYFNLGNAENRPQILRFAVYVATICAAFGWLIEWIQKHFCQDRMFDPFDGLANTVGAFGMLGVFIWRSRK
jgi:hypothetical protein